MTYLAVAGLAVGTLIAFVLGSGLSQGTVMASSPQYSAYEPVANAPAKPQYTCAGPLREQPVTRTEPAAWLLAMNPYVVVADAMPYPDRSNQQSYPTSGAIEGISQGARHALAGPEGTCPCANGKVQPAYLGQDTPLWPLGLGLQLMVSGLLMWLGWRAPDPCPAPGPRHPHRVGSGVRSGLDRVAGLDHHGGSCTIRAGLTRPPPGLGAVHGKAGLRMADERDAALDPVTGHYFEPIGTGQGGRAQSEGDDGASRRGGPGFRPEALMAAADWAVTVRTLRFWAAAVGTVCTTWVVAAGLVLLPGEADGSTELLPVPELMYLLAGFLSPAAAAMVAVQWGITSYARVAGRIPGARMFPVVLTTALQGLVLAVLIFLTLLVQAFATGQPATVAAVSAGVAAAEGVLLEAWGQG